MLEMEQPVLKVLTNLNDTLELIPPYRIRGFAVQCYAHTAGTSAVEVSLNGTTWVAVGVTPAGGGAAITSIIAAGYWYHPDITFERIRVIKTGAGAQSIALLI